MSFPRYEKYKDSGVEWLGEVPEHWEIKRLKNNLRLLTEKTNRCENPVALENVESWSGRFIQTESTFEGEGVAFECGDILFGKLRPYLAKACLAEARGEAIGDFHVLRPTKQIAGRFAQYQILNRDFIAMVDGSTFGAKMPRASWGFLGNMVFATPPIQEQQAIAAFLDRETAKIDVLIAEQQRLIELLKEKRQAVISHAVTKGLPLPSPHGGGVEGEGIPMKNSGIEWLGEVPEHWEVNRLKRISQFITVGIVVNPSEYISEVGFPFIYGGDISEARIDTENCRRISGADSARNKKTRLETGDLLTVRVGAPGMTAVVKEECEGGNCASVMLTRKGRFDSQWLCYAMNSRMVRYQVEVVQYGAAQEQFNISHAINFWIATPPREEQSAIAAFLDRETAKLDTLTSEAQRAIDLLKERRTALISAAVTGKIDVRDDQTVQDRRSSISSSLSRGKGLG